MWSAPVPRRPALVATLCAAGLLAFAESVTAQPLQCIEQHSQAQDLRLAGKLLESKRLLTECTRDESCPSEVVRECALLLDQLRNDTPSLVFAAIDREGRDTTAVKVYLGDQLVVNELGLEGIEFDPGHYTLRFEAADGVSKEVALIVRVGERNRKVLIDFRPPPPPMIDAPPPPPVQEKGGIPVASLILGSASILAFGSFGYFAVDGKQKENELLDTCASSRGNPGCSRDEVDSMRTSYLVADVSLGVGVASLGAAVALWLTSGRGARTPDGGKVNKTSWVAAPLPGGFALSASGRF